jgi:hypothetical protein
MIVKTRRVDPADEHERQKWYVLEGYVEGGPDAVRKRVSVAVAALVSRPALLEEARAKLVSDVTEYYANWLALQSLE